MFMSCANFFIKYIFLIDLITCIYIFKFDQYIRDIHSVLKKITHIYDTNITFFRGRSSATFVSQCN